MFKLHYFSREKKITQTEIVQGTHASMKVNIINESYANYTDVVVLLR